MSDDRFYEDYPGQHSQGIGGSSSYTGNQYVDNGYQDYSQYAGTTAQLGGAVVQTYEHSQFEGNDPAIERASQQAAGVSALLEGRPVSIVAGADGSLDLTPAQIPLPASGPSSHYSDSPNAQAWTSADMPLPPSQPLSGGTRTYVDSGNGVQDFSAFYAESGTNPQYPSTYYADRGTNPQDPSAYYADRGTNPQDPSAYYADRSTSTQDLPTRYEGVEAGPSTQGQTGNLQTDQSQSGVAAPGTFQIQRNGDSDRLHIMSASTDGTWRRSTWEERGLLAFAVGATIEAAARGSVQPWVIATGAATTVSADIARGIGILAEQYGKYRGGETVDWIRAVNGAARVAGFASAAAVPFVAASAYNPGAGGPGEVVFDRDRMRQAWMPAVGMAVGGATAFVAEVVARYRERGGNSESANVESLRVRHGGRGGESRGDDNRPHHGTRNRARGSAPGQ